MNKNRRNDQPRNCKKCSYSKIKDTAYYQGTKYILVKLLQLSISLLQALAAHTHLTPKRKEHVDPLCATYPQITVKSHVLLNFLFLRHVAFIVLGTLTLLDALLLIVAVILGQIGSTTYDTPSSRSNCTDWGGRLMIG